MNTEQETWYHVRISLADNEWGNEKMQEVADDYFRNHPNIAANLVVEVYEHGGWFLEFTHDGTVVGTANDIAKFDEKATKLRQSMKVARFINLPSIRR